MLLWATCGFSTAIFVTVQVDIVTERLYVFLICT